MRQALQTAQAGDLPKALDSMHAAVAQRPGHPAYLYNLACLQNLAGETEAALGTLEQLAGFGLYTPAAQDTDFASLKENPVFQQITARFTQNRQPVGQAEIIHTLTAQTGLIEGIARRAATGETFFGDMHHRCVWRLASDGTLSRFTTPDERVWGIGGLSVDEPRGLLWSASSAQEVMVGWDASLANRGALLAFDLQTGELRHAYAIPVDGRPHATVDLTLGADGTVYLSDSAAPIIWRRSNESDELEPWVEDARFRSLQGLALSRDEQTLFVADYTLGLFQINLATRAITAVAAQDNTLVCIDGLARAGDHLIAVQNGVNPMRVLSIEPPGNGQPASVTVLAANLPAMRDPTLGCVSGPDYFFIGQAGWDKFTKPTATPPAHDCAVLRLALAE